MMQMQSSAAYSGDDFKGQIAANGFAISATPEGTGSRRRRGRYSSVCGSGRLGRRPRRSRRSIYDDAVETY